MSYKVGVIFINYLHLAFLRACVRFDTCISVPHPWISIVTNVSFWYPTCCVWRWEGSWLKDLWSLTNVWCINSSCIAPGPTNRVDVVGIARDDNHFDDDRQIHQIVMLPMVAPFRNDLIDFYSFGICRSFADQHQQYYRQRQYVPWDGILCNATLLMPLCIPCRKHLINTNTPWSASKHQQWHFCRTCHPKVVINLKTPSERCYKSKNYSRSPWIPKCIRKVVGELTLLLCNVVMP